MQLDQNTKLSFYKTNILECVKLPSNNIGTQCTYHFSLFSTKSLMHSRATERFAKLSSKVTATKNFSAHLLKFRMRMSRSAHGRDEKNNFGRKT